MCVTVRVICAFSWTYGFMLIFTPLCFSLITGHLFYKFGITESDWYRIKQSIDSKCRTAWRRKQRGQSLAVKSFSRRTPSSSSYSGSGKNPNNPLAAHGLDKRTLLWVKNWLAGWAQRVVVSGVKSSWQRATSGVILKVSSNINDSTIL